VSAADLASVDVSAARKVKHVGNGGEASHRQRGGDQADRESFPQDIRRLPIDEIGNQRAREIGQVVDRSPSSPPGGLGIGVGHESRLRNRNVLHASNPPDELDHTCRTRLRARPSASLEGRNRWNGGLRRRQRRDFGGVADAAGISQHIVHTTDVCGSRRNPLMDRFPVPASPAMRANEAAGAAREITSAMAIVAEVLDITKLHGLTRGLSWFKPIYVRPAFAPLN
jgi:hypothetical protein